MKNDILLLGAYMVFLILVSTIGCEKPEPELTVDPPKVVTQPAKGIVMTKNDIMVIWTLGYIQGAKNYQINGRYQPSTFSSDSLWMIDYIKQLEPNE